MGTPSAVIGAIALAFHGYARATQDVDLATHADPRTVLRELAYALRQQGYAVQLILPDEGGSARRRPQRHRRGLRCGAGGEFLQPWNLSGNPGESSIRAAIERIPGYDLRVVDLPHLIALKLYAGGARSRGDVLELIERNREVDRSTIWRVCEQFHLGPRSTRCSGTSEPAPSVPAHRQARCSRSFRCSTRRAAERSRTVFRQCFALG